MFNPIDPKWLVEAVEAQQRGNLSLAESLCRMRIHFGAGDGATWNCLGRIAMQAGRTDVAARFFQRALDVEPSFRPARLGLQAAQGRPRPATQAPADARYLLIRSWGQGFWADVDHVLGQLLLAQYTGRTPVVYWGGESLFNDHPEADAWTDFFEPVSNVGIETLEASGLDRFPKEWAAGSLREIRHALMQHPDRRMGALEMMARPERVCVSTLYVGAETILDWAPQGHWSCGQGFTQASRRVMRELIRPTAANLEKADAFAREKFTPGRMLGLHIRGSDKIVETRNLEREIVELSARAEARLRAEPDLRLFLLTDWTPAVTHLRGLFGARVIVTPARRTDTILAVHYAANPSRRAIGEEVLIDALLGARCDTFLGVASSNVSCAVEHLKDWPAGNCQLLGERKNSRPNPYILIAPARSEPDGLRLS